SPVMAALTEVSKGQHAADIAQAAARAHAAIGARIRRRNAPEPALRALAPQRSDDNRAPMDAPRTPSGTPVAPASRASMPDRTRHIPAQQAAEPPQSTPGTQAAPAPAAAAAASSPQDSGPARSAAAAASAEA